MRLNYVIVFVKEMKHAVSFYRDVVGIPLRFESPDWTEFDTGGATLALHGVAAPGVEAGPTHPAPAGSCRPGFAVPDLDGFHQKMTKRSVPCIQAPKDVFGARVAQYTDPDGLTFSVSEERGRPPQA